MFYNELEPELWSAWYNLPRVQNKLLKAKDLINQSLRLGDAYVSCSWGKDSIVLIHLVQQINPTIAVVSFTHPERELLDNYAEVQNTYCSRWDTNLIDINLPGDHVPDKVLEAKLWEHYPVNFLGLRAEESPGRKASLKHHGLTYRYKDGVRVDSYRVCPLGWWTWQDVWAYICYHNLPFLNSYLQVPLNEGRTTDHVSKDSNTRWKRSRTELFKHLNPEYARYLQQHYPEMFY